MFSYRVFSDKDVDQRFGATTLYMRDGNAERLGLSLPQDLDKNDTYIGGRRFADAGSGRCVRLVRGRDLADGCRHLRQKASSLTEVQAMLDLLLMSETGQMTSKLFRVAVACALLATARAASAEDFKAGDIVISHPSVDSS